MSKKKARTPKKAAPASDGDTTFKEFVQMFVEIEQLAPQVAAEFMRDLRRMHNQLTRARAVLKELEWRPDILEAWLRDGEKRADIVEKRGAA